LTISDRLVIPSPAALPTRLRWLSALALALLCWLAFFHGLGALGLMDKTEALFVEVGHQMHQRGDWVTPWWNGERFFDYPVWGYWMVALSFRLFGVSEWAARLPVALAASAVVVAAFLLLLVWPLAAEPAQRRYGRALLGAAVLATSPGWIGWGRTSTTDMFLSSAISLALFGFLLALRHPHHPRLAPLGRIGLAGFSAVAVLAKGPVGLLLPGLVIVVFLSLTGQWGPWLRPWRLLAMALLFLGVCLPWYAAAAQVNGMAFLGGFLGFSNLQRFTSVIYDHPGPPWFYLPWVVLLLLPWSLFLPAAIGATRFWSWSRWRPAGASAEQRAVAQLPLVLLLWLGLMVAFFSAAATKLPGYILPALPAGALLVALWWQPIPASALASAPSAEPGPPPGWPLKVSGGLNAALLGLLAAAAALAPRWAASDPAHPALAVALERSGLPLRLALLLALASLTLVLLLRRSGGGRWLWVPDLAGFLAILALVVAPLAPLLDRERQLPLRQLAVLAQQNAEPGEPLWVVGTKRYSVLFYGGESAAFVDGRRSIAKRWRQDPAALGISPSSRSLRLLGDRRDLEELEIAPQAIERLGRRGEQELWRVPLGALQP
jgi:4-amino-4-deoxy-L-arabinose transferase-like glycosyltransferase